MGVAMAEPALGFSIRFDDLYHRDGLAKIDAAFLSALAKADSELHARLIAARATPPTEARDEADLLMAVAPHVEEFTGALFGVARELAAQAEAQNALAPLYSAKRLFVQRRAAKALTPDAAAALDGEALEKDVAALLGGAWDEMIFAKRVTTLLETEDQNTAALDTLARYAAWALYAAAGKKKHKHGRLFKQPHKRDPKALVPVHTVNEHGTAQFTFDAEEWRQRDGFALTDHGADLTHAMDEVHYCIFCHHQKKDSCSKGSKDKKTGAFAKNALGTTLTGCPLEERISEMHEVKAQGLSLAALAFAVIDNPMVAGTGHRICNDCMTACIYSAAGRDPVDIPQAETHILKNILALPWGFEIYSLLTRWNPLDLRRPLPKLASGRTVLVAGLGPAGITLAHHLMNQGHAVVAIDGLKIEPLPAELSGIDAAGNRVPFRPIKSMDEIRENLSERVMAGFGGVAEYGITVRWDKNYLKVMRLLLERRAEFLMIGGVRLASTITLAQAFAMGFDHVALCLGAGKPTIIDMPNNLAPGVRQASDFLMALQLTGAARSDSLANLQLRLPVVVIGGGLTAVDTATEALAYYPVQVEKFLARWETLVAERGETPLRAGFTLPDIVVAEEFLAHGRAIRDERALAKTEGREPRLIELLQSWGGATIAYRRLLIESPAYTRNHEEVAKALEEGIRFAERLSPQGVEVDEFGTARGLRVNDAEGGSHVLPAKSILVAAGTVPNTVLAREDASVHLHGRYFEAVDEDGNPSEPEKTPKPSAIRVLMSIEGETHVSFFGDLHPSFAGNVVTAMASAKQGYPIVDRVLMKAQPRSTPAALFTRANDELRATVVRVDRLSPTIVEVVVRAPAAARAFHPGQFYRLQNFESFAPKTADTLLAMEGLALTGAWVDPAQGLVSVIVLEMGGSSDLCIALKPGEPVVLMGPTGVPTETPAGETVLLAGGGLGNAVLFSIGQALRAAGSRVLYFAGYRKAEDRYKVAEIEAAADQVVWCVDSGDGFAPDRPQDKSFVGNIVQAMAAYAEGKLGDASTKLSDVDRVIAIGSDGMMRAVAEARHGVLAAHLTKKHEAIGSINSPMQCMMKEICAQCLQRLKDPETGKEIVVFTCAGQDQPLDAVDFTVLRSRLSQNRAQERLAAPWLDRALREVGLRK
ncbi:MAG TPA: FAD-dependent oxidoreductase [Magnetospirillaceae bacterium]|jgi:NADPH-dependent glutamate synthase beta subunit-like oxidoreductase/NAD(P)H-flavin reductase